VAWPHRGGQVSVSVEIHDTARDLRAGLTTSVEARQFVEETKIDILAPAVGNMHGMLMTMVTGDTKKRLDTLIEADA
jgi:fructose-bisphosphate aldolase class II